MMAVATPNACLFNVVTSCDNESIDLWDSCVNAMEDDNDNDNDDAVSQAFSQQVVIHFDSSMMFQELSAAKDANKNLEDDMEFIMSSSILTDLTDALDDMLSMDDDDDDLEVEPLPLESETPIFVFENDLQRHFDNSGASAPPAVVTPTSVHQNPSLDQ
jgi:hypothetical protein